MQMRYGDIRNSMKHIQKIDMDAKMLSLVHDFNMPDYSPTEYNCGNCGRRMKLKMARVLYCGRCHIGVLHPRYNFKVDRMI